MLTKRLDYIERDAEENNSQSERERERQAQTHTMFTFEENGFDLDGAM